MKVDPTTGDVAMAWRDRRAIVLHRAAFICEECKNAPAVEVDHIWPRSWGGQDELDNLRATCLPCNRSKGGKAYLRDITFETAMWTRDLKRDDAVQALAAAATWQFIADLILDGMPSEDAYKVAVERIEGSVRAAGHIRTALAEIMDALSAADRDAKAAVEQAQQDSAQKLAGLFCQPVAGAEVEA